MDTLSRAQIKRLENILRRRGASREDAQDFIQEALLRLLQYRGEVRNVEAFVCTTAKNEALNAHRQRGLLKFASLDEADLPDPASHPERAVLAAITVQEISRLLAASSEKTKTVFFAHRAGYEYREIADGLGMSMRIVEKHVRRGIALTRRAVRC